MVEPAFTLEVVGNSTEKVYLFDEPNGKKVRVKVSVGKRFLGDEELIRASSPNNNYKSSIISKIYYPEKTLEQKMDRAAIEYIGTLRDMYFA
jgi:hypothetical protein